MTLSTYRNILRRSHGDDPHPSSPSADDNLQSPPRHRAILKSRQQMRDDPKSSPGAKKNNTFTNSKNNNNDSKADSNNSCTNSKPAMQNVKLPPKITPKLTPILATLKQRPVSPTKQKAEIVDTFETHTDITALDDGGHSIPDNRSTSTSASPQDHASNTACHHSHSHDGVPKPPRINIVIIGGSFTGLSVAVTIAKNPPRCSFIITIVEPKSYLEVRWATIRSLFDDSTCKSSTIPLSNILSAHPSIQHMRARASNIGMDTITLDDERSLPYDVLLVATGAVHSFTALTPHLSPGTKLPNGEAIHARRKFLRETGDAILSARSVMVIGGGPVGTELAADVASFGRQRGHNVHVTLVDNSDKLMPDYPRSVSQKLRDKLSNLNVRLVLGQRATEREGGGWTLSESGEHLNADVVLRTTGVAPSAKGIFGGTGSESLQDGWVRTDRHGRVIGCRGDVFAGGDCCDWTAKSGENTLANRNSLSHNIRLTAEAIANNRALASIDSRLKRVSVSHKSPAVVASEPREGETQSPFAALSPAWWWMKNRGLLLAKAQKEIGW